MGRSVSQSASTLSIHVSLLALVFTMRTDVTQAVSSNSGAISLSLSVLSAETIEQELHTLPNWEVRDGWLRRAYSTPGWPHTLLLASQIAFLAEAAWHHPDLELGYARCVVKLQTHKVRGLTAMDFALARRIEGQVTWKPEESSPLDGYGFTETRSRQARRNGSSETRQSESNPH
jgi:4a-hydroxytetrahydrobiopterin dehydratase